MAGFANEAVICSLLYRVGLSTALLRYVLRYGRDSAYFHRPGCRSREQFGLEPQTRKTAGHRRIAPAGLQNRYGHPNKLKPSRRLRRGKLIRLAGGCAPSDYNKPLKPLNPKPSNPQTLITPLKSSAESGGWWPVPGAVPG